MRNSQNIKDPFVANSVLKWHRVSRFEIAFLHFFVRDFPYTRVHAFVREFVLQLNQIQGVSNSFFKSLKIQLKVDQFSNLTDIDLSYQF